MDQMFNHFTSTSNGNRFSLDLEDGMRPLLTGQTFLDHYHDGKTVVIPDSFLPPGWSKHAYRNFGAWLTFLLTPDGYRIETYDELDNYYYVKFRKTRPTTLDFSLDEELIPQLIYRQEHLMPVELFQYWEMQYIPTEKAMLISNSQDRNDDASCSHWPISYPSSGICGVENVSKNTSPSWVCLSTICLLLFIYYFVLFMPILKFVLKKSCVNNL
ncbi:uncharacterized protein LOC112127936 isoform X1 [Cimex lectularius]|uniref:Uncharacterized protein n=1 Tax=Cimex lectularius TaxID=79782 RepID=A0A8I6SV14_CIMLE|nr:uncharacterized protein LOC112127936 isoform X1 [Cimex lectularius]XP_024085294.1 uncharacterized protein LOC112127936 isoform X1 [Cimex lectularius]